MLTAATIEANIELIKVSLIEDSEIHREWLKIEIADDKDLELISCESTGRLGIESCKIKNPNLILLDFQLEDMTGLEAAKRIKAYQPAVKIFMLTAHTEISIVERIINDKNIDALGIKGSPYFENIFISAIKHVAKGGTYLDPSLLMKLRASKNRLNMLTSREFEIFIQTSAGKTDLKIAQDLSVEISHVKNIKSKITKKLKDDSDLNSLFVNNG